MTNETVEQCRCPRNCGHGNKPIPFLKPTPARDQRVTPLFLLDEEEPLKEIDHRSEFVD